jgi:tetratricopeptide (TPR) repeat protein
VSPLPPASPRFDRLGLEFLADFLGRAQRHRPDNLEALAELGAVYTRLGRYREGLAIDRRLVALDPANPTAHYNLACSLALCGEREAALDALEEALKHGYDDAAHLSSDVDLQALRDEARFLALVERLKRK